MLEGRRTEVVVLMQFPIVCVLFKLQGALSTPQRAAQLLKWSVVLNKVLGHDLQRLLRLVKEKVVTGNDDLHAHHINGVTIF